MINQEDQRINIDDSEQVEYIAIEDIKANPYQPRQIFDESQLNDLAQSIKQHGILQPIVLRESVHGYYIVVGERRYRASKIAGLSQIPAIIKTLSDEDMMELAVIENLQREDLNAIEEAQSYRKLMTNLNLTQQEVANKLGKSRPYIANMLRLLQLPTPIANMVSRGELSGAHGRTLLVLNNDTSKMINIAKQVVKEGWSVRYLEQYVNQIKGDTEQNKDSNKKSQKPKFIQQQERQLKEQYGSQVSISTTKQVGKITFEFKSQEEFKALIAQLNHKYRN